MSNAFGPGTNEGSVSSAPVFSVTHTVQDVADNPTDEYGDRLPRTRGRVVEDEEQVRPEKTSG